MARKACAFHTGRKACSEMAVSAHDLCLVLLGHPTDDALYALQGLDHCLEVW